MSIPDWVIPLLLALAALCTALAQLGGPRGAGQPYPARPWALAGGAFALAALVLVLLVALA